jgi:hypothetical protein
MPNRKAAPRAEFPDVLNAVLEAAGDVPGDDLPPDRAGWRMYAFLGAITQSPAGAPASLYASAEPPAGDEFEIPGLETVPDDLRLTARMTTDDLHRIRREFALKNHPDRVPPAFRALATSRMVAANTLIDEALARRRQKGR